jgi:hypothetical protein
MLRLGDSNFLRQLSVRTNESQAVFCPERLRRQRTVEWILLNGMQPVATCNLHD